MVHDFGWNNWTPPPPAPAGERLVLGSQRFIDGCRKKVRRVRNFVRRATTRILTHADYLLLAIKWRLIAPRTEEDPHSNLGFGMDPIWVFPFLERHSLEKSQLVCKLWHRIIDENHEQLALRTLDYYWLNLEERKRQKVGYFEG